jgi:hypothetical protein
MSSDVTLLTRSRRFKSLIRRPFLGVYHLEGEFAGEPLSILVADDGSTLDYIRGLAFPKGCSQSRKGLVSVFRAMELGRSDADVVVIGTSHLLIDRYKKSGFTCAPKSVRMLLPVCDGPDDMVEKLPGSAREDLRRNIRRMMTHDFSYEVTSDEAWFELFYHEMYKCYAETKFGDHARVCSYAMLKNDFRRGMGISISRDGDPVAGAVSYLEGATMVNHWRGILHGDQAAAREGAALALYYFRIHLAFTLGCKIADFGYNAPFVSDNVMAYKLKWGMEAEKSDNSRRLYAIAAPKRTEQAMRFLRANRFYCLIDGGVELCHEY